LRLLLAPLLLSAADGGRLPPLIANQDLTLMLVTLMLETLMLDPDARLAALPLRLSGDSTPARTPFSMLFAIDGGIQV
jgi:hypothetical protein